MSSPPPLLPTPRGGRVRATSLFLLAMFRGAAQLTKETSAALRNTLDNIDRAYEEKLYIRFTETYPLTNANDPDLSKNPFAINPWGSAYFQWGGGASSNPPSPIQIFYQLSDCLDNAKQQVLEQEKLLKRCADVDYDVITRPLPGINPLNWVTIIKAKTHRRTEKGRVTLDYFPLWWKTYRLKRVYRRNMKEIGKTCGPDIRETGRSLGLGGNSGPIPRP